MIRLNGHDLSIADVVAVARRGEPIGLDRAAEKVVDAAAKYVRRLVSSPEPVYGVTTGFGELAAVRVSPADARELQRNLVRSHAIGTGAPLPEEVVRAILVLRANALAAGRSGVRPVLVELLTDMTNRGVVPVIPEFGSVGASGDLAPLAHLALVVIGEGEAVYEGQRLPGADALKRAGLRALTLEPKEGLSLVNGTQVMTAMACLALHDAEVLAVSADVVGAMSAEALRATDRAWDVALHQTRPYPGQLRVAANLRALTEGSAIVASHRSNDPRVQDAYSVRCMPQVHGAVRDSLVHVRRVLEVEINAVTDNPLVFPELDRVISGGNFHGEPVAIASDLGAIAVTELADISEARIERLMDPHFSNLPPFLTPNPGLSSGFMVAQYGSAALLTELRLLATPASVHSIPTSAGMEDHVSMGAHAARKFLRSTRIARDVLATEALVAAQGIDLVGIAPAAPVGAALRAVRDVSPRLTEDRSLAPDIAKAGELIGSGHLLATVRQLAREIT